MALLERAQFDCNNSIYLANSSANLKAKRSLLDAWFLKHEQTEAHFGLFLRPEERPFHAGLPDTVPDTVPDTEQKSTLARQSLEINNFDKINLTPSLKMEYLELVPKICSDGSDGNFELSVQKDIQALKLISRRIHFGAFHVGECKFQSDPERFMALIRARATDEINEEITRKEVEEEILRRIQEKATQIQSEPGHAVRRFVPPIQIAAFYRETVIPLTKKGEVQYLLGRQF